eukprot:TRINITY_DN7648_c0_g1_i1.p1 TRINITY_DN7648_c0_g1~~TRINITY_DN7648_c0_g1_i1.p1  ORF type:complete len:383 (-),score=82.70 TRINITY_DN7648_c0_g1_i1:801-1949(-)
MSHSRVSLVDLITNGFLSPNEEITCKDAKGRLTAMGNIEYDGQTFTSLSNWASHVSNQGSNKFANFWNSVFARGCKMSTFRDDYLQRQKDSLLQEQKSNQKNDKSGKRKDTKGSTLSGSGSSKSGGDKKKKSHSKDDMADEEHSERQHFSSSPLSSSNSRKLSFDRKNNLMEDASTLARSSTLMWKKWVRQPYFIPVDPEDEENHSRKRRKIGATPESDLPLWKQFALEGPSSRHPQSHIRRQQEQQQLLHHILQMREAQNLPPVFAILTGPTLLQPYRMEELQLVLGRITHKHREADLHIGNNRSISRVHARIDYSPSKGCYCIVNFSLNGLSVKEDNQFIHSPQTVHNSLGADSSRKPGRLEHTGRPLVLSSFRCSASPS